MSSALSIVASRTLITPAFLVLAAAPLAATEGVALAAATLTSLTGRRH